MRIISGELRGRKLKTSAGDRIRPTSDRVRTAIFNILPHGLNGLRVLDLYAGTGALGLEALSRGALAAVFVDPGREATKLLKANIEAMGMEDRASILPKRAAPGLKLLAARGQSFDLVFLDPPYKSGDLAGTISLLADLGLLEPGARVIAEHRSDLDPGDIKGLELVDSRAYGKTSISFYRAEEKAT